MDGRSKATFGDAVRNPCKPDEWTAAAYSQIGCIQIGLRGVAEAMQGVRGEIGIAEIGDIGAVLGRHVPEGKFCGYLHGQPTTLGGIGP